MTREEAIKILEKDMKNATDAYSYHLAGGGVIDCELEDYFDAMYSAMDALREQESRAKKTSDKKTSEWISVEERLPQETGEVCRVVNLMMDNGLVTAGWLNDITGFGYFLDSRSSFIRQAPISRFTHWMPLPDAPEVEIT